VSDVDPDIKPSSYFVFRFFVASNLRDLYYRGYFLLLIKKLITIFKTIFIVLSVIARVHPVHLINAEKHTINQG